MSEHNNGIALIFARTETKNFFDYVWESADSILFIKKRLKFCKLDGSFGGGATAPSVLIAYGKDNTKALQESNLVGKLIKLK